MLPWFWTSFWIDPSRLMTFLSKGPLPPPPPPLTANVSATAPAPACALLPHMSRPVVGAARNHSGLGRAGGWKHGSVLYAVTRSLPRVSVALLCSIDVRLYIESGSETARRCRLLKRVGRHFTLPCPALPLLQASNPCDLQLYLLSLSLSILSFSLHYYMVIESDAGRSRGPARSPF